MGKGELIWADLSTYGTKSSIDFYSDVFGWNLIDESGYFISTLDDLPIAGLYETPAFFKKIKMPHFWMSYFQVDSVTETSQIAASHGGKVEINNIDFYNGKISLIRDPLGAGFTIYEGKDLGLPRTLKNNHIISTELHVSKLDEVMSFYNTIFDWRYVKNDENAYQIYIGDKLTNIRMMEIPKDFKGTYEYWVLTFKVKNVAESIKLIKKKGGQIINMESGRSMSSDNSGEAFFYISE